MTWLTQAIVFPSCTAAVCTRVCGGGNSGLSLRRTSALLPVATKGKLPEDLWGLSESGVRDRSRRDYFEDDEDHNNSETRWFEDDLQLSFKLSNRNLLLPIRSLQSAKRCLRRESTVLTLVECTRLG